MKSRKIKKFVTILTLVISLIAVQTLELTAMASTGTPDLSNPDVVVSDMEGFFNAVSTAEDGTVIGIDTVIYINAGSYQIGSEADPKHLYLVRKSGNAGIYITNTANLTIYNMTIDGNRSLVSGDCPMFFVEGALNLHYSTVQNSDMFGEKGTIYIDDSATLFSVGTTYTNNAASVGGHIVSDGTTRLNGCVLTNGSGREYGGAIQVSSGTTTIENCKIIGNQAGNWGGGINNAGGNVIVSQSVIYGNTANYGADIANDVNSQFQIDSLEDTMSLYEAEGISPVEWVLDGLDEGESNSSVTDRFNLLNPYSLMKLSCEDESAGGNDDSGNTEDGGTSDDNTGADDGTGDTEDGGTTGDGDNTGGSENSGNTEDSGTSDDTGNTEDGGNQDDTGSTEDGGNQDDSGNTEDSSSSDDTGSDDSGNQEDSGNTTDPDDAEDGDSTGDDSEITDGSGDNTDSGNQDSSTDESGDNTDNGNQDDTTGDTGEDNTQNDGSSDTSDTDSKENVTNNYYDQSSTTTNNSTTEDNSSVTNNTDNYEDKSSSTTTTTTTNNYYTYNTPQGTNTTGKTSGTKTNNTTNSTTGTEQKTGTVSGNSTSDSANMQLPDNLTLDLHGVDVSYEIVDGVPKIVISNDKVTEQAVAEQTEATTRTMEQQPLTDNAINTASVTADSENTSASINWYEIVKMLLLAAILIVVIYKPSAKKGTITAVD